MDNKNRCFNIIVNTINTVSFSGLLFITFLVLKLTHVIDWSWWWVCAPLWIALALLVLVGIICLILTICSGGSR